MNVSGDSPIRPFSPAGWTQPGSTGAESDPEATGTESSPSTARTRVTAQLPLHRGSRIRTIGPKKSKLPEPSAVAFHPERGTLFVAGDRGHIVEMSRDGEILQRERVKGFDLEGITIGPGGTVYAMAEDPPKILEFDPETLELKRTIKVKKKFNGERILAKKKNSGVEGLVYVPEEDSFFAVNQDKPSTIVRLGLPAEGEEGKARILEVISIKDVVNDGASDIAWDPKTRHFLITEAGGKGRGSLHEITRDGDLIDTHRLPGKRAEGFAMDDQGSAFIAQDGGRLLRIDP